MRLVPFLCLSVGLAASTLFAQTTVLDYPDSTINAPQGQYPVYTPTNGNTVRGQLYCPSTFAGLPTTPMLCSRVGIQISDQQDYTTFVVRAGTTKATALTSASWATNLPDQRIQADLSGTKIMGGLNGTTPVNIWVEFELNYPFLYTPGDALVFDLTAQSKVAGTYCKTAIGTGVPRALDLAYTPASKGPPSVYTSGGIKLRFVFQPLQWVSYGKGCPGTGNFVPDLSMTGSMKPGSVVVLRMANGLGGAPTLLFLGLSPLQLPLPIGGGCTLLTPLDIVISSIATGSGAGQGTAGGALPIPNDNNLLGAVVNFQFSQLDQGSGAFLPFTLSNGGKIVVVP